MGISIEEKLSRHLNKFESAPFLFVGSGFSRRYLGLDNWESLLREFAKRVNDSDEAYEYYASKVNQDKAKIGSLIAEDFHSIWFKEDVYRDSRKIYKEYITNSQSPFKIEIAKYMNKYKGNILDNLECKEEIDLLKQLENRGIDGIITTNYDTLLESIFTGFHVYVGQDELLFSNIFEMAEIYKIHGCCTNPNSIVITDEDYKVFKEKNKYLAAKLLTIFMEHPIIFIGYSISDSNIIEILDAIAKCLTEKNMNQIEDRLIFVEWNTTKDSEDMFDKTFIRLGNITLNMTHIYTKSFKPIYSALASYKRKYSPKIIRKLKADVYNLVLTNDKKESIRVVGIDDDTNLDKIEFVCGIGVFDTFAEKGYTAITPEQLYEDIVLDNGAFIPEKIVLETLPLLLKSDSSLPMYKYLNNENMLNNKNKDELDIKITSRVNKDYDSFLNATLKQDKEIIQDKYEDILALEKDYNEFECLIQIPKLGEKKINLDLLEKFLKDFLAKNPGVLYQRNLPERTNLRRLIKIYDWLKYGRDMPTIVRKPIKITRRKGSRWV